MKQKEKDNFNICYQVLLINEKQHKLVLDLLFNNIISAKATFLAIKESPIDPDLIIELQVRYSYGYTTTSGKFKEQVDYNLLESYNKTIDSIIDTLKK